MKPEHFLVGVLVAVASGASIGSSAKERTPLLSATFAGMDVPVEGDLPSLGGATSWLNSQPLTAASLRGRVVLVEFWTYTCINWRRQLPNVRAWAEKYKSSGLVVIGVHTPEFEFEKDVENVRRAVKDLDVGFPVAIDSDARVWRAFDNGYWPALYFVDAQGHVRHHQFGEGEYERSERVLQQLLTEAGGAGVGKDLVELHPQGAEAPADWESLDSPETYVRHRGIERFASSGNVVPNKRHTYAAPARLARNSWGLTGVWTLGNDAAQVNEAGGRIVYRFHARDLHLVMGPPTGGSSARFRVLIDGRPPGAAHGVDVNDQGFGTVTAPRMYQLIRQSPPIDDRRFEIEFLDPGVEAYSFTFG
jgi:thiol-disulfide isomerase/thioredoxin